MSTHFGLEGTFFFFATCHAPDTSLQLNSWSWPYLMDPGECGCHSKLLAGCGLRPPRWSEVWYSPSSSLESSFSLPKPTCDKTQVGGWRMGEAPSS